MQALFAATEDDDFEDTDDTGVMAGSEAKSKKEELKNANVEWKTHLKELKAVATNIFIEIKVTDLLPMDAKKGYYCNEGFAQKEPSFENGQRILHLAEQVAIRLGANIFPVHSTVFAKVGAALLLNRRRMLTRPTIVDNNMMAAIPTNVDPDFLYHFLSSIDFANFVQTGALPSVNQSVLGEIEIPDFILSEQRIIAEILSTLDHAIEKTEALIHKYQQIKAGLMHDLFTRGLTADGKLRPPREQAPELYQETPIGWIPKEWGIGAVQDHGSVKLGRQRSPNQHSGKWTTPYLRVANVYDGFIDYSDILEMDFTPQQRKIPFI